MSYTQEIHGLIGTQKDIEALSAKDHARALVISDSHRHPEIFEDIVRHYGKECDALIFCGDGIGDLVQLLNSAGKDKELKKALPGVVAFARGNGDPGLYPLDEKKSIQVPERQLLTINGHNTLIVHGHNEGVDYGYEGMGLEMQLTAAHIAFHGHTHVAVEVTEEDYKFVNPGSCARPRGGQPAGFAIATFEKNFIDIAFIKINSAGEGQSPYQLWIPIY